MSIARINLFWLIIFTLTLPVAVVLSTHLARKSFEKVRLRGQTITVKGYAEKPITSDRAEWSASIIERNADRTEAYRSLEKSRASLVAFLTQHGFPEEKVKLGPVGIREIYQLDDDANETNTIESYVVSQYFSIASDRVDAIAKVARESGSLIGEGIELDASSPRYLYTKLNEKKLDMLAEATTNARQRAERLMGSSGTHLGPLRSASQGVFQITPAFSTRVSSSGYNDTSSLEKVIKAVVTVEYAIVE